MKNSFILAIFILLTGCSNNMVKYNVYSKSGVDNAQLNADSLECRAMSKRLTGNDDDNYTMWQCMSSKGYSVSQRNRDLF